MSKKIYTDEIAGTLSKNMIKLKAPTGDYIIGTFECVQGVARINKVKRSADGTLDVEYEGTTELWWDTQVTQYSQHDITQRLFVDAAGLIWAENRLIIEDNE
jgi:hypothetical protein